MGVRVKAENREAAKTIMTTNPNSLNMIPVSPFTKMIGKKIAIVVKVEAITAVPTSPAPKIEASFLDSPPEWCR